MFNTVARSYSSGPKRVSEQFGDCVYISALTSDFDLAEITEEERAEIANAKEVERTCVVTTERTVSRFTTHRLTMCDTVTATHNV